MRSYLKILLIACSLWLPVTALAAPSGEPAIVLAQGGGMTLNEAVEQVRRQYKDGRIISAETRMKGDREVHHIRVMVDGKVKTVKINGPKRG